MEINTLNPEIYRQDRLREGRTILLGIILGICLLISLFANIILGIANNRYSTREPLVISYTPSGIPVFIEAHSSNYREKIEIETFIKAAFQDIFSFKYSDYLECRSFEDLYRKQWQIYKEKGVIDYFVPEYFKEFLEGLLSSQYLLSLIKGRVVTFSKVNVGEIKYDKKTKTFLVQIIIDREEITAQGSAHKDIKHTVTLVTGPRHFKNAWGLYIAKIA